MLCAPLSMRANIVRASEHFMQRRHCALVFRETVSSTTSVLGPILMHTDTKRVSCLSPNASFCAEPRRCLPWVFVGDHLHHPKENTPVHGSRESLNFRSGKARGRAMGVLRVYTETPSIHRAKVRDMLRAADHARVCTGRGLRVVTGTMAARKMIGIMAA